MSANGAVLASAATHDGSASGRTLEIVLEPLDPALHPELGEIRIADALFAIGRSEPPFASGTSDAVGELSRRHARIFSEGGVAYIADLGSKNGTAVNGVDIREKMSRLREGDEVRFGRELAYRVHLHMRAGAAPAERKLAGLVLQPERDDLGLQPIAITNFPFLVSKADAVFARYKDTHADQVNYLSRRHAHVFLKDGRPFVEDLGSTNGTFINGKRLDEHAAPLKEGDVIAFGGHHFVYHANLKMDDEEASPTVTMLSPVNRPELNSGKDAMASADADKTTFVAAADSFLDIFCVEHASKDEDDVNADVQSSSGSTAPSGKSRSRFAIHLAEFAGALADGRRPGVERIARWSAAALGTLAVLASGAYLSGMPEREMKDLIARGDFMQAATLASRHMEENPDSAAEFGALGTEALLKAGVPKWIGLLNARDFGGAGKVVDDMKRLGRNNPAARPLVDEVEWVGGIEQFVAERGGADAPLRGPEDEARINAFVRQWNEGTEAHQGAFAAISSVVPGFRDRYAETLSHLRKLALTGGRKDGGREGGTGSEQGNQQGSEGSGAGAAPEAGDGSAGRP